MTSTESTATLFTNYSGGDYSIKSGSQAVDAGYSLSSPYNIDANGVSRLQGSAFDIGAIEFVTGSTSVAPMPPVNLH